ncbi:hypothetical protein NIES267_01620 [Calothrix parasitica NIES-267]|uniref:Uncharacterized protein n=1 Tax=Calothrix parasitica NIES-267 TaxID=1973488 RepID=A0A1Z4LHI5_9CYAN|nr:hypothetical protein NIES267_01620 [Calothrix parasitica NIES-267]
MLATILVALQYFLILLLYKLAAHQPISYTLSSAIYTHEKSHRGIGKTFHSKARELNRMLLPKGDNRLPKKCFNSCKKLISNK